MNQENKIETHPFGIFLPEGADKLILGSFPCFNKKQNSYGDWFYSGSGKSNFWKLMSEVYGMPAESREGKERICNENGIAIADIISEVERINGNCKDANLKIRKFNKEGIQKCLDAGIISILFTSKFVENHFNKLFPGISVETFVLPSPSPIYNLVISGLNEYKDLITKQEISNAYEYRLIKYKKLLNAHR